MENSAFCRAGLLEAEATPELYHIQP